jgi:hypothetical protein
MYLFQSPPLPGDESFARHAAERKAIYESQKRAVMIVDALNSMESVTYNSSQGSLYVFPRI